MQRIAPIRLLPAAIVLAVLLVTPSALAAGDPPKRTAWAVSVDTTLGARQLGLSPRASSPALARAAVRRSARRLGLPGRRVGRLVAGPPAPAGARGLVGLRQSVGGLRVLWSQIDVIVSRRVVRGIRGSVVPLRSHRLRGSVKLSARRARAIARQRIAGPDSAAPARLVAYAGEPARPRAPRRAYVVAVDPASQPADDDAPAALCVVVDAASGRVLNVWRGSVAQPVPRRRAGADPVAQASANTVLAQYADAKASGSEALPFDGRDLLTGGNPASRYDLDGGFFNTFGNPTGLDTIIDSVVNPNFPGGTLVRWRRPVDLSTDAARFFCTTPNIRWCGRNGMRNFGLGPGYKRWFFTVNWSASISQFLSSQQRIYIARGDQSLNPETPAHEIGHAIDFFSSDDFEQTDEGQEVGEALADMFNFTYRGTQQLPKAVDSCRIFDFMAGGVTCTIDGFSVPSHYSGYNCTSGDEHLNSFILGHAYLRIQNAIGAENARALLMAVPRLLPARREFGDVHRAFEDAVDVALARPDLRDEVHDAFIHAEVATSSRRTDTCPGASP